MKSMPRAVLAIVIMLSIILSLSGCTSTQNGSPSGTLPRPLVTEEPSPSLDTVDEKETLSIETQPPSLTDAEIAALSNERVDWWFGTQVDEKNRPIHVVESQQQWGKYSGDFLFETEEKVVYLTFDCGFENGYTAKILDSLKTSGVKAVFFVTMDYVKSSPELVRRMIDEGHTVGNHSVTHPSKGMVSLSIEKQIEDVMILHEYVLENFGYTMHLFRYPAGIYSDQSLALLQSLGYRSVFWSFAYYDYDTAAQPAVQASLDRLVKRLHPGGIYLLHAVSSTNAAILSDFIVQGRVQGYTFAPYPN